MSKPNSLMIGNEHFKTWLKKLDPVARVEKMSATARANPCLANEAINADPMIRDRSAECSERFGHHAARAISSLANEAINTDPMIRDRSAESSERFDHHTARANPCLANEAINADPMIRDRSAECSERFGHHAARAISSLANEAINTDPMIRDRSAESSERFDHHTARANPCLANEAINADPMIRDRSAECSERFGHHAARAISSLANEAINTDPMIRDRSAESSERFDHHTARANPCLANEAINTDPMIRDRSAECSERFGHHIAKTLSSAGLKGSLIKASLAQLSQRCQVMLIKLSKKEIERHTRRKSVKRLHSPLSSLKNLTEQLRPQEKENKLVCKSQSANEVPPAVNDLSPAQKKLKKKYQELFGDDFEEPQMKKSTLGSPVDTCGPSVNNYLSATVNVNIYNSSSSVKGQNNENALIKNKPERSIVNLDKSSPNRVTINVSMSSNKTKSPYDDFEKRLKSLREVKTKSKHKHSKSKKIQNNNKANSPLDGKVPSGNSPEDDPSIKELWSILGMQSPTDRSVCIRSECTKLATGDDNVTVYKATVENRVSAPLQVSQDNQNDHDLNSSVSVIQQAVLEKSISSDNSEPFCKITGAFSLADVNCSRSLFDSPNKSSSSEQLISGTTQKSVSPEEFDIVDEGKKESNVNRVPSCGPQEIETISILDDDDLSSDSDHTSAKPAGNEAGPGNNRSMVGTIRVKNLGLLMNPQLISQNENSIIPPKSPINEHDSQSRNEITSNNAPEHSSAEEGFSTPPPEVEERFNATYNYYFDELVEMKVPKLGELLHLAIADEIRRKDRIKRAEHLSSNDLILEEKHRAEKDFNEMMKTRGTEFTPLCESILDRFDASSKCTLFCALFCRILKHAERIDPANKHFTLEARHVLFVMLSKHNFKNQDVLVYLEIDKDEFKNQIQLINNLIEKCPNRNSNQTLPSDRQELPTANNCERSDQLNSLRESSQTEDHSHVSTTQISATNVNDRSNEYANNRSLTLHNKKSAPVVSVTSSKDSSGVTIYNQPIVGLMNNGTPIVTKGTPNNHNLLPSTASASYQTFMSTTPQTSVAVVTKPQNIPVTNQPRIIVHKKPPRSKGAEPFQYQAIQLTPNNNLNKNNSNERLSSVKEIPNIVNSNLVYFSNNQPTQKPAQAPANTREIHVLQGSPVEKALNNYVANSTGKNLNMEPIVVRHVQRSTAQPVIRVNNPQRFAGSTQDLTLKYPQRSRPGILTRVPRPSLQNNVLLNSLLRGPPLNTSNVRLRKPNQTSNPSVFNNGSPRIPPVLRVAEISTPLVSPGTSINQESPQSTFANLGLSPTTLKRNDLPFILQVPPPVQQSLTQLTITPVRRTESAISDVIPANSFVTAPFTPTATDTTFSAPLATITAVHAANQPSQQPSATSISTLPTPASPTSPVNAIVVQTPVPSSSHCHPFVKRMPPSGKMKMFFGK